MLIALACELSLGRRLLLLARPVLAVLAMGTILGCLLVRDPWFRKTIRYSLQGAAIALLVAVVLFGARCRYTNRLSNSAPFRWVVRLSYSLYIWHKGIALLLPVQGPAPWQGCIIRLVAAFAVAAVSFMA